MPKDWQCSLQEMPLGATFFLRPIRCSIEFAMTFKIEKIQQQTA
jgi:hypothetical protein